MNFLPIDRHVNLEEILAKIEPRTGKLGHGDENRQKGKRKRVNITLTKVQKLFGYEGGKFF